jgi:hypothetical protein
MCLADLVPAAEIVSPRLDLFDVFFLASDECGRETGCSKVATAARMAR